AARAREMWRTWRQPLRLLALALAVKAQAEAECAARAPRTAPALADLVGLEDAKAVLQEAIVLPSAMAADIARLFWRSAERSAVLLAGPAGLGKRAAAEASAAAAGAQ
ncbi:unnamed protein product, partial [Polarella glacialis]